MTTETVPVELRSDPNLRWWLSGNAMSYIADGLLFVGLSWVLYEKTGSVTLFGAYFLITAMIDVFASPIAANIAEQHEKRFVCATSQMTKALIAGGLALSFLLADPGIYWIMTLGILLAFVNNFLWPATSVLLKKTFLNNIFRVNSLASIGSQGGYILGAGLGGFVVATLGPEGLFLIYMLLVGAAAITFTRLPAAHPASRETPSNGGAIRNFVSDTTGALAIIVQSPVLRSAVILQSSVFGVLYTVNVVLAPFAADVLKVGAVGFGIIDAAWATGAVIGGGILSFKATSAPRGLHGILGVMAVLAICLALFGMTQTLVQALVLNGILGTLFLISRVSLETMIQIETDEAVLARVRGSIWSLNSLVSLMIYGCVTLLLTADTLRLAYWFGALAIGLCIAAIGLTTRSRRI